MPTLSWSDVDRIEIPGQVAYRDMLISVSLKQIAHWKEDPDGRFGLSVTSQPDGQKLGELAKFYPSL